MLKVRLVFLLIISYATVFHGLSSEGISKTILKNIFTFLYCLEDLTNLSYLVDCCLYD